jgi:hypothetical protein
VASSLAERRVHLNVRVGKAVPEVGVVVIVSVQRESPVPITIEVSLPEGHTAGKVASDGFVQRAGRIVTIRTTKEASTVALNVLHTDLATEAPATLAVRVLSANHRAFASSTVSLAAPN